MKNKQIAIQHKMTLMEEIKRIQVKYPELRFGQLLTNAVDRYNTNKVELFFLSDAQIISFLKKYEEWLDSLQEDE